MAHLYAAYKCDVCHQIPKMAPIYHCPKNHNYCSECFRKSQRKYCDSSSRLAGCCHFCNFNGKFEKRDVNEEILKKLRIKPGIGRPCRYPATSPATKSASELMKAAHNSRYYSEEMSDVCHNRQRQELRSSHGDDGTFRLLTSNSISRRPIICLHNSCKKSVAVNSLLSHFQYDHADVPTYKLDRGKDEKIWFDVFRIHHNKTECLALLNLYETIPQINEGIGPIQQQVNSFWLMMSGSKDIKKINSYVIFWLYSNCEQKYWCTIELGSQNDTMNVSNFFSSVGLQDNFCPSDVVTKLKCVYVSYGQFASLLGDGGKIKLRVTIH